MFDYNLVQKVKVGDKFIKKSKRGFSMECFTAKTIENWLLGGWLGTHHQIQAFHGFSWNFVIS